MKEKLGDVFQRCVADSNDAIMLTHVNGTIFFVNSAWRRLYGYTEAEALGRSPRLLRSGRHDKNFYKNMWLEILDEKKGFWTGEIINRTKAGKEIAVLLTISPFRDEHRKLHGYMSIGVDMTHVKELEAQITRQDRLAAVGLLANGLAHEVGTPLGVIRGRAEFLLRGFSGDSAETKSLNIIVEQTDRIAQLIYLLLDLSKTDGMEVFGNVNVAEIIKRSYKGMHEEFEKRNVKFEAECDAQLHVLAEPNRLEEVFRTLFLNSLHAMDGMGEKERNGYSVRVKARSAGRFCEILVEDNGCGIPIENMSNLFKPFFTTKEIGAGTGLGLAIAYQRVRAWGGTMNVESEIEKGTTFKLILPTP